MSENFGLKIGLEQLASRKSKTERNMCIDGLMSVMI